MALTKVTYTDLVTIIGAQNLNDIQDAIIALEEWRSEAGADIPQILANIAPSFSNSTSYSAGDCVIVINKLYQFTADHPAGNWTGTDAEEVNVTSLLKEAADSLSVEVDSVKAQALASYATDTASGAIASFSDGADDIPVKDLSVAIEPVQDLHGQDAPYPAGGGKNLFDASTFQTETQNGVTCANNGNGSFTISGTATNDTFFGIFKNQFNAAIGGTPLPSAEYRLTGMPAGAGSSDFYLYTIPSSDGDTGNGRTFTSTITGGSIYIKSGTTVNNVTIWPMIRLAANGDDTFAPYANICPISGWTGANVHVSPTTDAADGDTYSISFPSEAGTVYGGTLDVTTGKLTVDMKMVDMGSLEYMYNQALPDYPFFALALPDMAGGTDDYVCSNYANSGQHATIVQVPDMACMTIGQQFRVRDSRYDNAAAFKAAVSGVQLCYALATPVVYDLTPIEVTTLLGTNNIWADTGDSTVEYRADTKLYVDKKIAALAAAMN